MDPETAQILDAIGPRLRRVRERRGLSLEAVAVAAGVSVSTVSRLETGARRPTLDLLLPLARVFRLSLDELIAPPATGDPRVHLRPFRHDPGSVVIPLTGYPGRIQVFKQVITARQPRLVAHAGYEWLYVLAGSLRVIVGERESVLGVGEVAEFDTSEPHWFGPADHRPVEVLHLFGPRGDRAVTAVPAAPGHADAGSEAPSVDPAGLPRADVDVHPDLVRGLLRAQHPDLAELPLSWAATGWDNVMYRLGERLAVRLPRITAAADLLRKEQEWLPRLAATLPVAVPAPVRLGRPGQGYPWPWSVVPWVPGETVARWPLHPDQAGVLGRVLGALHAVDGPQPWPRTSWRGVPLGELGRVEADLDAVAGALERAGVDVGAVREMWRRAREVPRDVPEVLVHGDLHPRNLVGDGGALAAVLDWGDLTAGDPATDLAAAWMLFPVEAHRALWEAYGAPSEATLERARGWAVFFGVTLFRVGESGDPGFGEAGRITLARLTGGSG